MIGLLAETAHGGNQCQPLDQIPFPIYKAVTARK
jgi:hypothetical protein